MSQLSQVFTRASTGLDAPLVTIEVHISSGLPGFSIVGLPEGAVRESKERVRSALINSQFKFPKGRITVSLAPANLPKSGGRYDLPIAISRQFITMIFLRLKDNTMPNARWKLSLVVGIIYF
ncbi:AAA+ ATPase superfamily protein YifB/ComM, associated with DNA recombination [uncultured Gammaproteobacteria bacterium]|nr:AAA+ ATPase superfamily protein YifB/ComM, associated with DNA recombination [uncultured Gammaproteobacteria bacterium]